MVLVFIVGDPRCRLCVRLYVVVPKLPASAYVSYYDTCKSCLQISIKFGTYRLWYTLHNVFYNHFTYLRIHAHYLAGGYANVHYYRYFTILSLTSWQHITR